MKSRLHSGSVFAIIRIVALLLSAILGFWFPVAGLLSAFTVVTAWICPNVRLPVLRSLVIALYSTAAAWLVVEIVSIVKDPRDDTYHQDPQRVGTERLPHFDLGYAPRPGATMRHIVQKDGRVIYDAQETISKDRLRIPPPRSWHSSVRSILVYGCSFAFGVGVSDSETFSYQLERLGGGDFWVHNFGFPGYGPHQMLSSLEQGFEAPVVAAAPPASLVYSLLADHPLRAAGLAPWDLHGPRYEVNDDGLARRHGVFTNAFTRFFRTTLQRSYFVRREVTPLVLGARMGSRGAMRRLTAILRTAKRLFEDRYGGRFMVLDFTNELSKPLARLGIETIPIEDILPAPDADYFIKGDGHPTSLAHELIAAALYRRLMAAESVSSASKSPQPVVAGEYDKGNQLFSFSKPIDFDGQTIDLGAQPALDFKGTKAKFTIHSLLTLRGGEGQQRLISRYNLNERGRGWSVGFVDSRPTIFLSADGSADPWSLVELRAIEPVAAGANHHVIYTVDAERHSYLMYVDGVPIAARHTAATSVPAIFRPDVGVTIGSYGTGGFLHARVLAMTAWKRVLTPAQVKAISASSASSVSAERIGVRRSL